MSSTSSTTPNGNGAVPLRLRRKKARGNTTAMSRRRISCKDLGHADFQGWLFKKKESKGFIGNKWKKYWFMLKGSSLYWYLNQTAEKAEGFISLPEFLIDKALECKKKHAIKASHPQLKSFYFAAENADDMSKWMNKMGLAVIQSVENSPKSTMQEECWSESEADDTDISADVASGSAETRSPFCSSQLSSEASSSYSSPESSSRSSVSVISPSKSSYQERQSWLDIIHSSHAEPEDPPLTSTVQSGVGSLQEEPSQCEIETPQLEKALSGSHNDLAPGERQLTSGSETTGTEEQSTLLSASEKEQPQGSDEMEQLYKSLEQASLSPIGQRRPSSKRDYRKSFIKRSKNPVVNDRLHKFRALNSTLKSKQADLAVIDQLLEDAQFTAEKFRQWKEDYSLLLQDICKDSCPETCPEENASASETLNPSHLETDV